MYGMTNSWKLFSGELTEWLPVAGFIQYQCHMYMYYKYAQDGKFFLFYLMLMTLYIGVLLKLLENGLWILQERDYMWASWDMHIGPCQ